MLSIIFHYKIYEEKQEFITENYKFDNLHRYP